MNASDSRNAPDAAWIEAVRARFPTERAVDETLTLKMQRRASPASGG